MLSLSLQLTSGELIFLHSLYRRAHYFSFHTKLGPAGEGQNIDVAQNQKLPAFAENFSAVPVDAASVHVYSAEYGSIMAPQ